MKKKLINIFKNNIISTFRNNQLLTHTKQYSNLQLLRNSILSFGLISGFYYLQKQQAKFYALTEKNSTNADQEPINNENQQNQIIKNINYVKFNEAEYNQALEKKYDVIIFVDPRRFRDEFVEDIHDFLEKLNMFQQMIKGRKLMFFKLEIDSREEFENFQKKYQTTIEPDDTVFLLKNKYSDQLYTIGSYDYFHNKDYIFRYFQKVQKLNSQIWNIFTQNLSKFTSDQVYLVCYSDPADKNYKKYLKMFGNTQLIREYSENQDIHFIFINDPIIAEKFGIQQSGDAYIMVKSSKYNKHQTNLKIDDIKFVIKKSSSLNDGIYSLIANNTKSYNEINLFNKRSFYPENFRYTVILEVDSNKITKSEFNKLIRIFSDLKEKLKSNEQFNDITLILLKRAVKTFASQQQAFQIYMRDEDKSLIPAKIHQETKKEEIEKLQQENGKNPTSCQYLFNGKELAIDSLLQWISDVKTEKIPHYFKSQQPSNYRKVSKKLVSSSFKQNVIDNDIDQIVFFYSNFCVACKSYGEIYEQFALENINKNNEQKIQFNRFNSDSNNLDCSENYPYTPVFAVYKKGAKNHPLIYRSYSFTSALLNDFIQVSSNYKLMEPDTFDKLQQNYTQFPDINQFLNSNQDKK